MKPNELEKAIVDLLDGMATEGDAAELQEILKTDASARELYLEHACLHGALEYRFANASPVRFAMIPRAGWWRHSRYLAACAAVAVGLVLTISLWPERPAVTYTIAPQSSVRVEHAPGKTPPDGTLKPGSRVRLDHGTLEWKTPGGTVAIVEGPADFTLAGKQRLELMRGIAWFRMGRGDPWTIATPAMTLVDFGTRFGVMVPPSGKEEVHVFEGKVAVVTRSGEHATLAAGDSRAIEANGRLQTTALRDERFLSSLPDGLPVIHFTFDEMNETRLSVAGTHPDAPFITARISAGSPPPRLVPGRFGQALRLSKDGGHIITDWSGISGIAARTVTFWIKVSSRNDLRDFPAIVSWGDPTVPTGKWKLLLIQEKEDGPAYPRISIGDHGYDAPVAVNDGKWHHLAMSFSGRMGEDGHPELAIHLDGVRQPLTYRNFPEIYGAWQDPQFPREPRTRTSFGASPLEIGGFTQENFSGTFDGTIDELRIYPGLLPEADIRAQATGSR